MARNILYNNSQLLTKREFDERFFLCPQILLVRIKGFGTPLKIVFFVRGKVLRPREKIELFSQL